VKPFTANKVLRRSIVIKSSDRAIADSEWVLSLGLEGVRIRRLNSPKHTALHLSWRSIIGHALIHKGK